MKKIVGKKIILLFMMIPSFILADIVLHVTDIDHAPLTQAEIGCPFLIEVVATDMGNGDPQIEGIDKFSVRSKGNVFTLANGKMTVKYKFEVRIDQPGSYLVGPAFFPNNSSVRSNSVHISVAQSITPNKNGPQKKKSVLLRLTADKKDVVVGERVQCRLYFYSIDPTISLQRFIEQDSNLVRKNVRGPYRGTEKIDETDYHFVEWRWDVVPPKENDYVIPAYGADYEQQLEERNDFWGGLGRFLGNHIDVKRLYSNSISLHVNALPHTDKPIRAIGHFLDMRLSAQPTQAKQSEGVVVALEITGYGDPDGITFNELSDLPESLRFYESKQTVIVLNQESGLFKKRFEFVVQGLKEGNWQIPSQSFYYFDTHKKTYGTLKTDPLSLTIIPGIKQTILPVNAGTMNKTVEKTDLAPLHTALVEGSAGNEFKIPWWLCMVIFILPGVVLLYHLLFSKTQKNKHSIYRLRRAKKAFSMAFERLAVIKKKNEPQKLYKLFMELFADRWQESIAAISNGHIKNRLKNLGNNNEELAEWDQFFVGIAERAFGFKEVNIDKSLFEKAEQWIERLEKQL